VPQNDLSRGSEKGWGEWGGTTGDCGLSVFNTENSFPAPKVGEKQKKVGSKKRA